MGVYTSIYILKFELIFLYIYMYFLIILSLYVNYICKLNISTYIKYETGNSLYVRHFEFLSKQ